MNDKNTKKLVHRQTIIHKYADRLFHKKTKSRGKILVHSSGMDQRCRKTEAKSTTTHLISQEVKNAHKKGTKSRDRNERVALSDSDGLSKILFCFFLKPIIGLFPKTKIHLIPNGSKVP